MHKHLAVGAVGVSLVIFAACVGDDPTTSPGGDDSGAEASANDSAAANETSTPADGASCPGAQTLCGASCVDLQTADENCGRCGHTCMGDGCDKGACKPFDLLTGLSLPTSIATDDGTDQIAVNTNGAIQKCAKAGCGNVGVPLWNGFTYRTKATSPLTLTTGAAANDEHFVTLVYKPAASTPYYVNQQLAPSSIPTDPSQTALLPVAPDHIAADHVTLGGDVALQSAFRVYDCAGGYCMNGSPSTVQYQGEDSELAIAVFSGPPVLYVWPTESSVHVCARGSADGGTCTTSNLFPGADITLDGGPTNANGFAVATATTLYWGTTNGVLSCPLPGGCTTPKVLVDDETVMNGFAADDSGIFWTDQAGGRLRACLDTVHGCGSSSVTLLSNLAQPSGVAIDKKTIFVAQTGVSAGQGKVTRLVR